MKVRKKMLAGVILAISVVLIAISFLSASPRLPAGILRKRLLIATPMGTSIPDVRKFIMAKGWKITNLGEEFGGIPYFWDGEKDPQKMVVGCKCIDVSFGRYAGVPFLVSVEVFWGFDDQSRLIDIWVRKTSDGL